MSDKSANGVAIVHNSVVVQLDTPNDTRERPPLGSFIVVLAYSVLTVTAFTIAIPTATSYVTSLGGSDSLAGWLVGITPIFAGVVQPLITPLLKRFQLKTILIAWCFVNAAGASLYALGQLSNWLGTILIARGIQGAVGGPTYASSYVSRSTGPKSRTMYMQYVSVGIGLGYGL